MKTIYVKDFTEFPGPRFKSLGDSSGEEFRLEKLLPVISEQNGPIIVNLDGTMGYGSSFLEEAFGGLVRDGVDPETVMKIGENLISSDDPSLIGEIQGYIQDELDKLKN